MIQIKFSLKKLKLQVLTKSYFLPYPVFFILVHMDTVEIARNVGVITSYQYQITKILGPQVDVLLKRVETPATSSMPKKQVDFKEIVERTKGAKYISSKFAQTLTTERHIVAHQSNRMNISYTDRMINNIERFVCILQQRNVLPKDFVLDNVLQNHHSSSSTSTTATSSTTNATSTGTCSSSLTVPPPLSDNGSNISIPNIIQTEYTAEETVTDESDESSLDTDGGESSSKKDGVAYPSRNTDTKQSKASNQKKKKKKKPKNKHASNSKKPGINKVLGSEDAAIAEAIDQKDKGSYSAAITILHKALIKFPQSSRLLLERSKCYYNEANYTDAQEDAEEAFELLEQSANGSKEEEKALLVDAYITLGKILSKQNILTEAIALLEQGLKMFPKNPDLAQAYRDTKTQKQADSVHPLSKVAVSNNNENTSKMEIYAREICYTYGKKVSRDSLGKIEKRNKNVIQPRIDAARKYEERKQYNEALKEYEKIKYVCQGLYHAARLMHPTSKSGMEDAPKCREYLKTVAEGYVEPIGWSCESNADYCIHNMPVAAANFELGKIYHHGISVDADPFIARKYYMKGAQYGSISAMINFASLLVAGEGGDIDAVLARVWLEKAIDLSDSNPEAAIALAYLLWTGEGGKRDPKRANLLATQAKNAGNPNAIKLLLEMGRSAVAKTSDLLPMKTIREIETAANNGNLEAAFRLAKLLIKGVDGCTKDLARAEGLFMQCIANISNENSLHAVYELVELYRTQNRLTEAYDLALKFAEKGDKYLQNHVGRCLIAGTGVICNVEEGCKWLTRAGRQGLQESRDYLQHLSTHDFNQLYRDLKTWETQHNIATDNKSMSDRLLQYVLSSEPTMAPLFDSMVEAYSGTTSTATDPNLDHQRIIDDQIHNLQAMANSGNTVANDYIVARQAVSECAKLSKTEKRPGKLEATIKKLCIVLYNWYGVDSYQEDLDALMKSVDSILQSTPLQADALYCKYVTQNTSSSCETVLAKIEEALKSNPNHIPLLTLYADYLSLPHTENDVPNYPMAIRQYTKVIQFDSESSSQNAAFRINHVYAARGNASLNSGDNKSAIADYEKFLAVASPSSYLYPEVCYSLAFALLKDASNSGKEVISTATYNQINELYNKGIDAERPNIRIPIFSPVNDKRKSLVKFHLHAYETALQLSPAKMMSYMNESSDGKNNKNSNV